MSMSDSELNSIVNNEIEWRKHILKKLDKTDDELKKFKNEMLVLTTTLKIKIGFFGGFFGFISGACGSLLLSVLKSKT